MIVTRVGWLALSIAVFVGSYELQAQDAEFVYISNVTGVGEDSGDIEVQTTRALENLGEALQEHGLGYEHVVVSNVFLKDTRHFQMMNQIYRGFFSTDPPTRATVQADLLDPDALFQISVVAARGEKQIISPASLQSPELPYSWGIKVGKTLFISGATSRNPETYQPVSGDVSTQTDRVFGNVGLILEEAGMDYGDLVVCKVFLEDGRIFGGMNSAYREFVPADDPPARATVRSRLMNPVFNTEIQCIAEESSERSVVIGEGRSRSRSPFSPGISTGNRLYLSGMVGSGEGGVPSDVQGQTRNTLANLEATLAAADMDFTNVVDTWVYVTDIRQWAQVEEVLAEVLPEGSPTPTIIGAPLMGATLLVEIQMTAER
ncbi:MAG: Rid family hydrolase [Gemmatimonadota bacterium]|nr:Rid family hydrolase [Gemmatimonadota bacterium]